LLCTKGQTNQVLVGTKAQPRKVDESNLALLESGLISLALNGELSKTQDTNYGRNYVISGLMVTPKKRRVSITTVWTIDKGDKKPRFVTAYPLKRKFYRGGV